MAESGHAEVSGGRDIDREELDEARRDVESNTWSSVTVADGPVHLSGKCADWADGEESAGDHRSWLADEDKTCPQIND